MYAYAVCWKLCSHRIVYTRLKAAIDEEKMQRNGNKFPTKQKSCQLNSIPICNCVELKFVFVVGWKSAMYINNGIAVSLAPNGYYGENFLVVNSWRFCSYSSSHTKKTHTQEPVIQRHNFLRAQLAIHKIIIELKRLKITWTTKINEWE